MFLRNQGRCIESFLACVRKSILIFARYFPTSPDWQRLSRKVCSSTSLAESGPSERQRGRKVVFSNVTTQGGPGQGWWPILQRPATSQSQHSQSSVSVSHLVSVCVMGTCLDTRTQYLLLTDEHEEDDLVPDLPQAQTLHASLQSKIHFRSTYQISLSIVSNLSSSSQY